MKSKPLKLTRRNVEKHFMNKAEHCYFGQHGHNDKHYYRVPTLDDKILLVGNDTRELMIKLCIYHDVQIPTEEQELVETIKYSKEAR